MNFRRLIHPILIFICAILLLSTFIVLYLYKNNKPQESACIPTAQAFCRTKNLSENAQIGKKIFNSNFAACHKLNAKLIGPALRSVDSIKYWSWLSSKKVKLDSTKLEQLAIEFHLITFSRSLTKEDLENIYNYTRPY